MAEKKSVWEKNYAENPKLAEMVSDHFVGKMKLTRANRITLQESWLRFWNMWSVVKDGYHSYKGNSTLYIPEVRKNIEEQARQMTEAAFPTEDFFDVSPGMTGTKKGAQAWRSIHRWGIENCQLRSKFLVAMRQQAMLGTSPIYIPWNKILRREMRTRRNVKTHKLEVQRHEIELFNGPDFVVRDLFKWYVFNTKKGDLLDGCFEDTVVGNHDLIQRAKQGLLANKNKIMSGPSNAYMMEELIKDVQRAESVGIQIQNNTAYSGYATLSPEDDEKEDDATYLCSVIYADMVFPEACEPDEDKDLPIPMKVEIYDNGACGLIMRNPFYHQRPPYVVGKYILPNADEFYGQGIPWATQYMQYEINTKSEQAMDSATLALNPIAIVDPGLAGANNEFEYEPGAIWWANPQGVHFTQMPDVAPVGYQAISQIKAMMMDYSDRSPALPPQLLGKSRTATQSTIVDSALNVDNKTFQLQNEQMILEPMLEMWEALVDQNMEDDQIVMVLGRRATDLRRTLISKADLLGRYRYFWKAASTMQNRQMLGSQMLNMMKVLSMFQPEQLGQLKIHWDELIKVLWDQAFQLPDGDRVLGAPEEMVTQDAVLENKMAKMGLEIEVLLGDDDLTHMPIHDVELNQTKDPAVKSILIAHQISHKKQVEQKQATAEQAAKTQMLQMQMQAQGQGQPQGGGRPRSQGSGNRTQLPAHATTAGVASGLRA